MTRRSRHRHRHSSLVREAVAVLGEHGFAADVDLDGKHVKVSWISGGHQHTLVVARSPSDRCADVQSCTLLRRLLREEGRP